jgi:UDP-N-acetylglucosamine 2-epimerase (non-hydrolysing)
MRKVLCVVGTRPEAIKMAPVYKAMKETADLEPILLLSGQHKELLDQAMPLFETDQYINLNIMKPNQTLSELTGRAFIEIEKQFDAIRPDMILAQGDTTTVLVVSMVAFYMGLPFGHVEAGLRTGDRYNPFPEEINRVIADRVSSLHFAPTPASANALLMEGIDPAAILVTGNTVIDTLAEYSAKLPPSPFRAPPGEFLILLTSHRRENFGDAMRQSFLGIRDIVEQRRDVHVVYPVHPNPNVRALADEVLGGLERVRLITPLNYFDFIALMNSATIIVTDSGGVQEEAPYLSKPVLVLRNETERPEAVQAGVARLIGPDRDRLREATLTLIEDPASFKAMAQGVSPYGDGRASLRICQRVREFLGLPTTGPQIAPFRP